MELTERQTKELDEFQEAVAALARKKKKVDIRLILELTDEQKITVVRLLDGIEGKYRDGCEADMMYLMGQAEYALGAKRGVCFERDFTKDERYAVFLAFHSGEKTLSVRAKAIITWWHLRAVAALYNDLMTKSMVPRVRGREVTEASDYFQDVFVKTIEVYERYDVRGNLFGSYVKQHQQESIRETKRADSLMPFSKREQDFLNALSALISSGEVMLDVMTDEEICDILNRNKAGQAGGNEEKAVTPRYSLSMVKSVLDLRRRNGGTHVYSLDRELNGDEDGYTLADTIEDPRYSDMDEVLHRDEDVVVTFLKDYLRTVSGGARLIVEKLIALYAEAADDDVHINSRYVQERIVDSVMADAAVRERKIERREVEKYYRFIKGQIRDRITSEARGGRSKGYRRRHTDAARDFDRFVEEYSMMT